MRVFDRLIGLETEYAIRFRPDSRWSDRPSNHDLFEALIPHVQRRIPLVRARHFKKGYFLATGGAVWFEKVRQGVRAGFIEGTTPECRGPRQLLAYQRAQDELLASAAQDVSAGGSLVLLKNDRDPRGHVYGAQENYEVPLPPGGALQVWRWGVACTLALVPLVWLLILALVLLVGLCYAAAALLLPLVLLICALLRPRFPRLTPVAARRALFGRDIGRLLKEGDEFGAVFPGWLEPFLSAAEHLIFAIPSLPLLILARLTLFRDIRKRLLPFLITRGIFCGSGRLERDGSYHVSSKATGLTCVAGLNAFGVVGDRPIFSFGHLVKALVLDCLHYGRAWRSLFADRQRLQICLGDSNLCEEAEYLRIGTTLLVLDAITGGFLNDAPSIRRPISALRKIAADLTLRITVTMSENRRARAIEIQWLYLNACRAFLAAQTDAPAEAWDIVHRWQDVLERLEREPRSLVGRIDWITKQYLIQECGANASWEARKKIDIRYHELSPDGFFRQFQQTGLTQPVLSPEELERAIRLPPENTRAAVRGRYIREFGKRGDVQVNWNQVHLTRDGRVIDLDDYGRGGDRHRTPGDPESRDPQPTV